MASFLSRLARSSEVRRDPFLTRVLPDFTRCRNYSILFHNSDPSTVRDLVSHKCSAFVENPDLRYPQMFRPHNSRPDSLGLLNRLQRELHSAPEQKREEILGNYVAYLCEIDAAIVAHLEIRKSYAMVRYRSEFVNVVDAYDQRLHRLYINEVPFGRTDVSTFFHESVIVWLVNADEEDAVDYIHSYLTAALWTQLNLSHGWFETEEEKAWGRANRKKRILNKAHQRKWPTSTLDWRREPASE